MTMKTKMESREAMKKVETMIRNDTYQAIQYELHFKMFIFR
jgi:hypothetical protein